MTQEDATADQGFRITVDGGGVFFCSAFESLLAAMIRRGIREVPVGCRGGGCGVCRVRVLSGQFKSGKIARSHVTEAEENDGYALACRLFPQSDLTVAPARRTGGDETTR